MFVCERDCKTYFMRKDIFRTNFLTVLNRYGSKTFRVVSVELKKKLNYKKLTKVQRGYLHYRFARVRVLVVY